MIKKCIVCEENFNVRGKRRETAKFCSRKCRSYLPEKECEVCKNKFKIHSVQNIETSRFCSRKCKGIASRKPKIYQNCGVEFFGSNSGKKYCSRECGAIGRRKYENRECLICTKQFYASYKNQKFCSVKCSNDFQGRNKISFTCIACGETFKWSKSRIFQANPTFCSIECRNKNGIKNGWSRLLDMLKQQQLHNPTNLELLGYSILDNLGIEYVKQFEVKNKFLVDAFLPNDNIILQFDGDYWHGNPIKYPILNERQTKQVKKDQSQNKYLLACGYKVIRVWESDMKQKNYLEGVLKNAISKK